MESGLLRDVTEAEIETYRKHGVVRLRGVLPADWVSELGIAIDQVIYDRWEDNPVHYDITGTADALRAQGAGSLVLSDVRADAIETPGQFRSTVGSWLVNDALRRLVLDPRLGYLAARLTGARAVSFYENQTFMKEPGTREYTAFHTDEPYFHLQGDQILSLWMSPDSVSEDSGAMRYIRGSHRWGQRYKPNPFISQTAMDSLGIGESEPDQQQLPDIEGRLSEYDVITHPSEPGDVIAHHLNLVHGSGPNYTADRKRRAVSVTLAGDDAVYWFKKSAPPQPHQTHGLANGAALGSEPFVRVWPA
ncbi:MAG: phytanoyl-CoA dioxygenase family protein [Pseudomonadales bacterium]|jgi:ectoine hydroxylase-related dioxygenase (phytanoyl-CoA dioxygenase family)